MLDPKQVAIGARGRRRRRKQEEEQ